MSEHKNPYPGENNTGHFWDDEGDLRELNNRPPRWYMHSMFLGLFAILVYSFYFPSVPWFGEHYKGYANEDGKTWTMITEMEESVAILESFREKKFSEQEKNIAEFSLEDIVRDEELNTYAIKTARTLFGDNCAACHGPGGQGNRGFPVLVDDDWLYGGSLSQISATITRGKKGSMPAKGMLGNLTDPDMEILADYVMGLSEGKVDHEGKAIYMKGMCMACHGPTGKPLAPMAANLTDRIWRFEADDQRASVLRTIKHGVNKAGDEHTQKGEMPAFGKSGVIDEVDIKKLTVYVHQLGGGDLVKPAPKKSKTAKTAKNAKKPKQPKSN